MQTNDIGEFRRQVGDCLAEVCGWDDPVADEDGDWPVMVRGVGIFVRVSDQDEPHVQMFTRIADNVSPEAWAEINHLNAVMFWAKLVWLPEGQVMAVKAIHQSEVNPDSLDHALEAIATYARDTGSMMETVYGMPGADDADGADEVPTRRSPRVMTSLPPNGVFVFGSGMSGRHSAGAALNEGSPRGCAARAMRFRPRAGSTFSPRLRNGSSVLLRPIPTSTST